MKLAHPSAVHLWREAPPAERISDTRRLAWVLDRGGPIPRELADYLTRRPDLVEGDLATELKRLRSPLVRLEDRRALEVDLDGSLFGPSRGSIRLEPLFLYDRREIGRETFEIQRIRPGVRESRHRDLEALEQLRKLRGDLLPSSVLGDFREHLDLTLDLPTQSQAWHNLEEQALPGLRLSPIRLDLGTENRIVRTVVTGRTAAPDLAQLAGAWLRLLLEGRTFPLRGDRLLASGVDWLLPRGTLVRLDDREQAALSNYLTDLVLDRGDEASAALGTLLRVTPSRDDSRRLRGQMRQLVAFRDAPPPYDRESLAVDLLLHWRLLGQLGLRPGPSLLRTYQSLHSLLPMLVGHEEDALRAGWLELEVGRLTSAASSWMDPLRGPARVARILDAALELPDRLVDPPRIASPAPPPTTAPFRLVSILLCLAAIALLGVAAFDLPGPGLLEPSWFRPALVGFSGLMMYWALAAH